MAFEVLEHIEDDHAALRQWLGWLKPGGILLMSVPAHPSQWNAADVWAGHFRRYRKRELLGLVEENVLELEHVRSDEHTSELQSLNRTSYAVFCLKQTHHTHTSVSRS